MSELLTPAQNAKIETMMQIGYVGGFNYKGYRIFIDNEWELWYTPVYIDCNIKKVKLLAKYTKKDMYYYMNDITDYKEKEHPINEYTVKDFKEMEYPFNRLKILSLKDSFEDTLDLNVNPFNINFQRDNNDLLDIEKGTFIKDFFLLKKYDEKLNTLLEYLNKEYKKMI